MMSVFALMLGSSALFADTCSCDKEKACSCKECKCKDCHAKKTDKK